MGGGNPAGGLTFQKILFFSTAEEIISSCRARVDVSLSGSDTGLLDEAGFAGVIAAHLCRLNFARTASRRLPLPLLPVSPHSCTATGTCATCNNDLGPQTG